MCSSSKDGRAGELQKLNGIAPAGAFARRPRHPRVRLRAAAIEALEQRTFLSAVAGPDAHGYMATTTTPLAIALSPTASNTLITGVDDSSRPIGLGSDTFTFYGHRYSGQDLFASTNGLISFGLPAQESGHNSDLSIAPTISEPNPPSPASIAPLWDDWVTTDLLAPTPRPSIGQVLYQFVGDHPDGTHDQLIVQWNAVHHYFFSPGDVTFQAVLSLNTPGDGDIIFNYIGLKSGDESANGATAAVGIKDAGESAPRLIVSVDHTNPAVAEGQAILISHPNRPPLVTKDDFTTKEGAPLDVGAPGVLANDSDPDGDPITAMQFAAPMHGQLHLQPSGAFTYTPDLGFSGTDTFRYVASDGLDLSVPATVSVTVVPVGTAPMVTAADASGVEGSPISLSLSAALVDTDDSETLGVEISGVPAGATLSAGTDQGKGVWSLAPGELTKLTLTSPDNASAALTLTLTATATESTNGSAASTSTSFHVTVVNAPPVAAAPSVSPTEVGEGGTVAVFGSFSDAGALDTHTVKIYFGDGPDFVVATVDETTKTYFASHTYADDPGTIAGTFPITATVMDNDLDGASAVAVATVHNVAPTITSLTSTLDPVSAVTGVAGASAEFTDPGMGDIHSATWDWGDGITTTVMPTEPAAGKAGTVTGGHTYAAAGTYTVRLTVRDDDGGEQTLASKSFVVVFDSSNGFVTGGGWIDSPAGAYVGHPTVVGKGRFGFVSKNKQGTTTPTGQTQFTLNAGNLSFHSTSYDRMTVSSGRADYRGAGTLNGTAGYQFQLTAIDGSIAGGLDRVRFRIWNDMTGALIYDNGLGALDDATPGTALAGGSIVIHT